MISDEWEFYSYYIIKSVDFNVISHFNLYELPTDGKARIFARGKI